MKSPLASLACALLVAGCASAVPRAGDSCASDADCADGLRCYPDGHCHLDVGCEPACAAPAKCDPDTLRCVTCLADGDCPGGFVCVMKVCRPGCSAGHSACAPDAGRCDVDLGVCRGCLVDAECKDASRPRCDRNEGLCVACLPDNDNCPAGKYCASQKGAYSCQPGCKADGECAGDSGARRACCGHTCIDSGGDVANCGGCGKVCPKGNACCGGDCADFASDAAHCGDCNTACTVANGAAVCVMGRCGVGSCNPGFADCDNKVVNGCETNLGTSAANCGACGMACPSGPNVVAGCVNGVCQAACAKGFADCNNNLADGCETALDSDLKNCGGCGNACPAIANGSAICVGGTCALGMCNAGYKDCNRMLGDGCEIHSASDVKNCGSCGNACPNIGNGAPSCVMGLCNGQCNPPFGDCDKNLANGCEANLSIDVKNCGACGKACAVANGAPNCANGACGVASCNNGFGDCDKNAANGCEAVLATDTKNCGACGNVCPVNAPNCVAGVCGNGCLAGGKQPPSSCVNGKDAHTGAPWTVCRSDCNTAWLSMGAANGGNYHPLEICNSLGYTRWGSPSGTCNNVCSYCSAGSCNVPGRMSFDGGGSCGQDQWGPILCLWVMWQCLR